MESYHSSRRTARATLREAAASGALRCSGNLTKDYLCLRGASMPEWASGETASTRATPSPAFHHPAGHLAVPAGMSSAGMRHIGPARRPLHPCMTRSLELPSRQRFGQEGSHRSSLKPRVGELVAVVPQAIIAAGVRFAATTLVHSPVGHRRPTRQGVSRPRAS